jgi:N-acetylneuraminic acid mutarotase
MKKTIWLVCLLLFVPAFAAAPQWEPLPIAVSGNAVAGLKIEKKVLLFSFMGIGQKKTWEAVTNRAFALDTETGKWTEQKPVPGPAGRIDATAIAARDAVYLLGGFTLDGQGGITSVRSMEMLLPGRAVWYRGQDMPIALDNTVVGVYRDRFIYTVGGRSQGTPVQNVQLYDAERDAWSEATRLTGSAVFGHAGGIVDDTIVYIGGAQLNPTDGKPRFVPATECWIGKIDHKNPAKIQWTKLPPHPGSAHYQIAAAASDHDHKIYFSGGSEQLYSYSGMTYGGAPAQASAMTFAFNVKSGKWEVITEKTPNPTLGNRALVLMPRGLVRIGGIEAGQKITANVTTIARK